VGLVLWKRFQFRYHLSFTPEEIAEGKAYYNYGIRPIGASDEQGISIFYRNERGEVFHTYSCHGRGIDMVNGALTYSFSSRCIEST
jgi:predicted dithiol-disulfide oxidoreductase (DUF899 family)